MPTPNMLTAVSAIPWDNILAEIQILIKTYGPLVVPYIEQYISGLNLPFWVVPILNAIIKAMFGQMHPSPVGKMAIQLPELDPNKCNLQP